MDGSFRGKQIKLNSNGSFDLEFEDVGLAFIARNFSGLVSGGRAICADTNSLEEMEALVLLKAVKFTSLTS